jgi:DNA sulfur modification protein DndE
MKVKTGIDQWNILCRWAFCISLKNATPPALDIHQTDSNVEMTWKTFSGTYSEAIIAAHIKAVIRSGVDPTETNLATSFHAHIERGIGKLQATKSLEDLFLFASEC